MRNSPRRSYVPNPDKVLWESPESSEKEDRLFGKVEVKFDKRRHHLGYEAVELGGAVVMVVGERQGLGWILVGCKGALELLRKNESTFSGSRGPCRRTH